LNLTSRLRLVKPTAPPIVIAALASLLTLLSLAWASHVTDDTQARTDAYGSNLATGFAALAIEPMLKQDRMHLAVISNRILNIDEVADVTIFSADNKVLAATGESASGPRYSEPVTFDEGIMGYVQITLDSDKIASPINALRVALALAALLGVPVICVAALSLRLQPQPAVASVAEVDFETPGSASQHFLLALNLYNQIGLTPEQRTAEMDFAGTMARRVGDVYSAEVHPLPGTGLLVHFPDSSEHDRGLQVLCAAFVIAKLLEEGTGIYRLGLHTIDLPTGASLPDAAQEISDVALLSALAKHMTLAVSDRFPLRLLQQDRVECYPLDHPLLDEISTAHGRGYLITALSPAQETLVSQQVLRFSADQDDSTANESTF
jgi:uncharacterized membrane protein affecting hemolysin expression